MSSIDVLPTSNSWSHTFYNRHIARTGESTSHSLSGSHRDSPYNMSVASSLPSSCQLRTQDVDSGRKLSRSNSSSSRGLSSWGRRQRGDVVGPGAAEYTLSSPVQDETLPPGDARMWTSKQSPIPLHSSNASLSSTSQVNTDRAYMSRLFSLRRKQRAAASSEGSSSLQKEGLIAQKGRQTTPLFEQRIERESSSFPSKNYPSGALEGSPGTVHETPSILYPLDLNETTPAREKSSTIVQSSSPFSSLLRKGSRHTQTRASSREGILQSSQPISPPLKPERRARKLSLGSFNLFRANYTTANTSSRPTPTTPEIEMWKAKNTASKENESATVHCIGERQEETDSTWQPPSPVLPYLDLANSPRSLRALLRSMEVHSSMSHSRRSTSDGDRYTSALGLISGEEGNGPAFVSSLNAISSGWTEAGSVRSTTSKKRKPVPSLDLSAMLGGGESTVDSSLPSFPGCHRPYSLISTDTEGNDTPIVRLRSLVVDTKESEAEKESQLFFRPLVVEGTELGSVSGSSKHGREIVQDRPNADVDMSAGEMQRKEGESRERSTTQSIDRRYLYDDNQLQYQQQQQSRFAMMLQNRSLSAQPSMEARQESGISSPTDSSVYEAVLSRATSTRFHSQPLRRIKVEEWAQQLALAEKCEEEVVPLEDSNPGGLPEEILEIPDESASSRDDIPSNNHGKEVSLMGESSRASREEQAMKSRQSSSNLSEAARLGGIASKRLRTTQISDEVEEIEARTLGESVVNEARPLAITSGHFRKGTDESQRTMKSSRKDKINLSQRTKSGRGKIDKEATSSTSSEMRTPRGKKDRHRHAGRSRSLTSKRGYLTSEEAATAKRREQEERERMSKERRHKKELARQEAYAERKRNDPLLKTRLALVGLAPPYDGQEAMEEAQDHFYNAKVDNNSSTAMSRTSFHTAHEEEAEEVREGQEDALADVLVEWNNKKHRRNQASTASDKTIMTRSRGNSTGALTNATFLPFPLPPKRYAAPVKSEDGTILARARLQSQEGLLLVQNPAMIEKECKVKETTKVRSNNDKEDALRFIDGHRVALNQGASVREPLTIAKKPVVVADVTLSCRNENEARSRRSHVPETFDRYSMQSSV